MGAGGILESLESPLDRCLQIRSAHETVKEEMESRSEIMKKSEQRNTLFVGSVTAEDHRVSRFKLNRTDTKVQLKLFAIVKISRNIKPFSFRRLS
jgi:hypothetical protein